MNCAEASMASFRNAFLIAALACSLLAGADATRPCKTFFISYSFSSLRPAFHFSDLSNERPSDLFVFAEFDEAGPRHYLHASSNLVVPEFPRATARFNARPEIPRPEPFAFTSIRDRTKDILSVVAALLFGVGCGALTSAAMYMVWLLVSHSHRSESEHGGSASEAAAGYVKIPSSPVKEGYETKS